MVGVIAGQTVEGDDADRRLMLPDPQRSRSRPAIPRGTGAFLMVVVLVGATGAAAAGAQGLTVRGTIVGAEGQPLRAAPVEGAPLQGAVVELMAREPLPLRAVIELGLRSDRPIVETTGVDGRFELAIRSPAIVDLRVRARGYAEVRLPLDPLIHDLELGTIALRPGTMLAVHVQDEDGAPIQGAVVAIEPEESVAGADRAGDRWVRSTGGSGVVGIVVPDGHALRVDVTSHDYLPASARVPAERSGEPLRVVLPSAPRRSLVARDPEGRPVYGTVVFDAESRLPLGMTDEQGRLEVAVPADRPRSLLLRALSNLGNGEVTIEPTPDPTTAAEPVTVTLQPAPASGGVVVDAETGDGIEHALIFWSEQPVDSAHTAYDGSFGLRLSSVADGAGGPVTLRVAASGYVTASLEIGEPRAPERNLAIALTAIAAVPQVEDLVRRPRPSDRDPRATSDANGRFVLDHLPTTPWSTSGQRIPGTERPAPPSYVRRARPSTHEGLVQVVEGQTVDAVMTRTSR